jgi:hypothetical protein
MKYLIALLLSCSTFCCTAQKYLMSDRQYQYDNEESSRYTPAYSEWGFNLGYCPTEGSGGPTARVVFTGRVLDHLQLFGNIDAVFTSLKKDIGVGLGVNIPFGLDRSYFYPGVYAGYFLGTSIVYGGQIGYVGYVSSKVGLLAEVGYRTGSTGGRISGNSVVYVPVTIGLRFAMD